MRSSREARPVVTPWTMPPRLALRSALGPEAQAARCLMDCGAAGEKIEGNGVRLILLAQNRP